jgi:hypothetical protein
MSAALPRVADFPAAHAALSEPAIQPAVIVAA